MADNEKNQKVSQEAVEEVAAPTEQVLTRDLILNSQDQVIERVPVPEWGGAVYVRGLTGRERDAFEGSISTVHGKKVHVDIKNIRAKMCALAICDANGVRLFKDVDVIKLGEKSGKALDRCFDVAQRLSGISEGDLDDLTKNSESEATGGLSSD